MSNWEIFGCIAINSFWVAPLIMIIVEIIDEKFGETFKFYTIAILGYTIVTLLFILFINNSNYTDKIDNLNSEITEYQSKEQQLIDCQDELDFLKDEISAKDNIIYSLLDTMEEYEHQLYGSSNENPLVYVTRGGTKYHWSFCSYVQDKPIMTTLNHAVGSGYTPCSECMAE